MKLDIIPLLCNLLENSGDNIINVALQTMENIITMDQDEYSTLFKEAGGFNHLESLQNHDNQDICDKSAQIIESFWKDKENSEDEVDNMDDEDDINEDSMDDEDKMNDENEN